MSNTDRLVVAVAVGAAWVSGGITEAGTLSPFSELGIARGIHYPVVLGGFQLGSGLGLFDMDGDGDADALVIGALDGRVGLYENDGAGYFTDRTYDAGAPRMAMHPNYAGVSAADFDGDGDLDVYLSRYGAPNLFYRNDGDWVFTDISASSGLDDPGHALSTAWADCNADGRLDVYVCNRTTTNGDPTENSFYENNGDGTFSEKAALAGIQRPGDPTLVAAFFDFDADSDPDLYLGTDKGYLGPYTNHMFENTGGGVFENITDQSGTSAYHDTMGIALGDIDRNGHVDMYLTNIPQGGHALLTANGDGTFTDASAAAGVQAFQMGWGTLCLDFDNDTLDDLYVCHANTRNYLYHNTGSFPMAEIGLSMNVATPGASYNAASADVDGDGDLDLIVNEQGQRIRLYINNEGQKRSWAMFDVVGRHLNIFGVGAQVRVRLEGMAAPLIREVRAGHHYKAQDPTTVHFGLGDAVEMAEIVVNWPNSPDVRTLTGYPANERWTLYPPERMGDADLDGDVDGYDQQLAYDLFTAGGARPVEPGIEMLDMDGDGDFDGDDMDLIGLPCLADVAPPYGLLDLADIGAFVSAFTGQDALADLNGDGLHDLADLGLFVSSFLAGCP